MSASSQAPVPLSPDYLVIVIGPGNVLRGPSLVSNPDPAKSFYPLAKAFRNIILMAGWCEAYSTFGTSSEAQNAYDHFRKLPGQFAHLFKRDHEDFEMRACSCRNAHDNKCGIKISLVQGRGNIFQPNLDQKVALDQVCRFEKTLFAKNPIGFLIANIPYSASEADVSRFCAENGMTGKIVEITIPKESRKGKPKGHAIVKLQDASNVLHAVSLLDKKTFHIYKDGVPTTDSRPVNVKVYNN